MASLKIAVIGGIVMLAVAAPRTAVAQAYVDQPPESGPAAAYVPQMPPDLKPIAQPKVPRVVRKQSAASKPAVKPVPRTVAAAPRIGLPTVGHGTNAFIEVNADREWPSITRATKIAAAAANDAQERKSE